MRRPAVVSFLLVTLFAVCEPRPAAGEEPEPFDELIRSVYESADDAADCTAMLRAEAETGADGLPFWTLLDEARVRHDTLDAILLSALSDDAARRRVEDADRAAADAVTAWFASPPDARTADAASALGAAGTAGLVRLLDATVGSDPAQRLAAIDGLTALRARPAVPHLVWLALAQDEKDAAAARRALETIASLPAVAPRDEATESAKPPAAALLAWWDEAKPRDRASLRHLAHRVLHDLTSGPVGEEAANERAARLGRVLGRSVDLPAWRLTDDDPPRLHPDTVAALRAAWSSHAPPPPTWRSAAAWLGGRRCYSGPTPPLGGTVSRTRRTYEILATDAPADALAALAAAPPPVARLCALRALVVREGPSDRALDLLERLAHAPGEVVTQFGCIVGRQPLAEVALEDWADPSDAGERRLLGALLDRRIHPLRGTERLLRRVVLDRSRRPQLRRLADDGIDAALQGIALWRDAEDGPWLAARIEARIATSGAEVLDARDLLTALATHGTDAALPALVRLAPRAAARAERDEDWNPAPFIAAVAAPRNAAAERALLEVVGDVAGTPARLVRAVVQTLVEANDATFPDLRWRLWEAAPWSRSAAVEHLASLDRPRALRLIRRDLATERPGDAYGTGPRVHVLHDAEPQEAVAWVAPRLRKAMWQEAEVLAEAAAGWREEALVEPLLDGLAASEYAPTFLSLARALLCYGSEAVDERLAATVAAHAHLRSGRGGAALAALLRDRPRTWDAVR